MVVIQVQVYSYFDTFIHSCYRIYLLDGVFHGTSHITRYGPTMNNRVFVGKAKAEKKYSRELLRKNQFGMTYSKSSFSTT